MKRSREETVELPQDFAEKHIDTFVKGCHHILGVDPSLYDALLSKDFQLFLKREQPPMDLNHHLSTCKQHFGTANKWRSREQRQK